MVRGELDGCFAAWREQGDVRALGRAFDLAAPELLVLARRLAPDEASAEDLVQVTLLTAIERAAKFDANAALMPWLVGILTNKSRLARALRAREVANGNTPEGEERDVALEVECAEFLVAVDNALRRVPPKYREVLRGHLADGKKPAELALELGRSPGTIRVQLHRGLALLRQLLPASFALGLGVSLAPRGLAALRSELLRNAQLTASAGAGVSSSLVLGGAAVTSKLVFASLAIALAAVSFLWLALSDDAAPPVPALNSEVAHQRASVESVDAAGAQRRSTEPEDSARALAPELEPYGALDIDVFWSDATPAAGVELTCTPFGERQPFQRTQTCFTDAAGRAVIERVHAGSALVSDSVRPAQGSVRAEVRPGERSAVRLVLEGGVELRGRVIDSAGLGVPDATIWLDGEPSRPAFAAGRRVATTHADGSFEVRCVPSDGLVFATAVRGSSAPLELSSVAHGADSIVVIELALRESNASVDGRVLSVEGAPIAGALVSLRTSGSRAVGAWPWVLVRSDELGRVRADGLHPGPLELRAVANGYAPGWTTDITLTDAETAHVELVLDRGATVRGLVVEREGRPVPGASVELAASQSEHLWERLRHVATTSDEQGRFRLEELGSDPFELTVHDHARGRRVSRRFELRPGAEVEWTADLDSGLELRGVARTADGSPLADWTVEALPRFPTEQTAFADTRTAADGSFVLRSLSDVEYVLRARQPARYTWAAELRGIRPPASGVEIVAQPVDATPAHVTGVVVDARGAPVPRVRIGAYSLLAGTGRGVRTAASGAFRVGPLEAGDHELVVHLEHRPPLRIALPAVKAGENRDVGTLTVEDTGAVRIKLRAPEGVTPDGARLALQSIDGSSGAGLASVGDGIFTCAAALPGRYRLHLEAHNVAAPSTEVAVRAGETSVLDVSVVEGRRWAFLLDVGTDSAPLGRSTISVHDADGVLVAEWTSSYSQTPRQDGIAGAFSSSFPAGRYSIGVVGADGRRATLVFDVTLGNLETQRRTLVFPR